MRLLRVPLLLGVVFLFSACSDDNGPPPRTYMMGERAEVGHIIYTVFETQWLTHIGEGADARVPQNRFFLVRLSATNGLGTEVIVPNVTVQDDSGNSYPELTNGEGVPQWIGFLRNVKPAESAQGNLVFDAPPRHYKLKVMDETSERMAFIDIPLSFGAETPELPTPGGAKGGDKPPLRSPDGHTGTKKP